MRSTKNALEASGFITEPMISIPSNRIPKEKMTMPMFFQVSFLDRKLIIKPMKMIG